MLLPGAMPTSAQARRACSQSMLAALEVTHDPSSAVKQQIKTIRDMLHPLWIVLTSAGPAKNWPQKPGPFATHAAKDGVPGVSPNRAHAFCSVEISCALSSSNSVSLRTLMHAL